MPSRYLTARPEIRAQLTKVVVVETVERYFGASSKSSYNIGQASIIISHHERRSPRK
jgi:hypothetical protein